MTGAAPRATAQVPLITPLDPDSDKGHEVAARLSEVFAQIREEIAADEARSVAMQRSP